MNTCIVIRCVEVSSRVVDLAKQLRGIFPNYAIVASRDRTSHNPSQDAEGDSHSVKNPYIDHIFDIDSDFIAAHGLHHRGNETGWACGDYSLYRALELDWTHAWLVEPDVFFTGEITPLIHEIDSSAADMIAPRVSKASSNWHWFTPLNSLFPDLPIYGMTLCFARFSRDLTLSAMQLRQSVTGRIISPNQVPNDESVLSSVAHRDNCNILELESKYPEHFKYWSTVTKFSPRGIAEQETTPQLIHGGLDPEGIVNWLADTWVRCTYEGTADIQRVQFSASTLTHSELRALLGRFLHLQNNYKSLGRKQLEDISYQLESRISHLEWQRVWTYADRVRVFDFDSKWGPAAFEVAIAGNMISTYLYIKNPSLRSSFEDSMCPALGLDVARDEAGRYKIHQLDSGNLHSRSFSLTETDLSALSTRIAALFRVLSENSSLR